MEGNMKEKSKLMVWVVVALVIGIIMGMLITSLATTGDAAGRGGLPRMTRVQCMAKQGSLWTNQPGVTYCWQSSIFGIKMLGIIVD
jgi:hypothetical protein